MMKLNSSATYKKHMNITHDIKIATSWKCKLSIVLRYDLSSDFNMAFKVFSGREIRLMKSRIIRIDKEMFMMESLYSPQVSEVSL